MIEEKHLNHIGTAKKMDETDTSKDEERIGALLWESLEHRCITSYEDSISECFECSKLGDNSQRRTEK